jgi:REP element-mobilizing transposase RayT
MERRPPLGYSRLRKGRVSLANHVYVVTTVTRDRARLFEDLRRARMVIRAIRDLHDERAAKSLAFVVMPDHLHWLVQLGEVPLSRLVQLLKSRSARAVNLARASRESVWQAGFHDRAIRLEQDLRVMARYIIANPVRAGLAGTVGDYPHWDCVWL